MADSEFGVNAAGGEKLTDWAKEPTVVELKLDLEAAKPAQQTLMQNITRWNELLTVTGAAKPKTAKGRSSVQPKLVRRQAEWRYSALTEPFLGSSKLFKVSPATFEDAQAARQNELVLNYQFRTKFNKVKFIDDLVRSTVDDGTCIIRTGWCRQTIKVEQEVPIWDYYQIQTDQELEQLKQAVEAYNEDPRDFDDQAPPEIKAAVEYFLENATPVTAKQNGTKKVKVDKILKNQPTAEILNPANVYIDPSCNGDIDKAMFAIVSFETNKAELVKEGRYKNLDKVDWETATILAEPDHTTQTPNEFNMKGARKKVVAYEYWGFFDMKGDDSLVPFVATWIGNIMIRMEVNPFPDQKLPFVIIPYLPIKRALFGEPDAELLEDNQKIAGAVTRGMIDLLGKSANAQHGFAKGMLDPLNRRRYEQGQDYEFNPGMPPQQGLIEHKYPELPQSALVMLNLQNQEGEALTGVKSFSGGMSGDSYGQVAAGVRGMLDAASKREMAILRRLAKGMISVGEKFAAMNGEFLSDEETIRITNEEFVKVKREDLAGNFDLDVDISTAEVDNAKSQDLAFILQTVGPDEDPDLRKLILAEICDLKRMPELAHKIKTFQPQPDPFKQRMQELTLQKLEAEVNKLNSEAEKNASDANLKDSQKDKTNLDFVEQETGTKHLRDMEKQRGQAEGNQDLEVTKALLKPKKPDESKPDVEAAVGWNQISKDEAAPDLGNKVPVSPDAIPGEPVDNVVDRNALATGDPRYSLGSMHYDPSLDPATNPSVNM